MKQKINEAFIKKQLDILREGVIAEEKLYATEVIDAGIWLDPIIGSMEDTAWNLLHTVCDVASEEDDEELYQLQFNAFLDYMGGKTSHKNTDEFIKWWNEIEK